jgi:lysophospholipase L1-like esterase
MRGYAGLIAKRLEQKTGKRVRVVNLSVTGAQLSDYLQYQAPKLAGLKPDFVTIEIGANDIRTFNQEQFRHEFEQVVATLPDGTYVSNMPLFNSRRSSTAPAKQASQIIKEVVANYPKLHFVDLEKQTSENQSIFGFAPDLFHPNNLSYKNWADAFWLEIDKTKAF